MRSTTLGSLARRLVRAATVVSAFAGLVSCSDHPPVAPKAIAPGHSRLSLHPSFQKGPPGGPTIDLRFVEAFLTGPNGESIHVHADFVGDSAILVFDVPISGGSTTYNLDVTAFDASGQPAFHTQTPVTLKPGENTPASPQLVYSAADAALTALHVAPATVQLDAGGSSSLGVSGTAGSTPVSSIHVAWTSKDPNIASVDANGAVHAGVLQGATYIVARTYTNVADSALVRVKGNVAKVTVAPATLTIARGLSAAVGAELRDAANTLIDDRTATWTTSDPAIATVSSSGVIQGVALGTATITATAGGKSATAAVTVVSPLDHIELSPSSMTFASLGETQTITARLVPVTNASVAGISATLSSSDASVATVDASGVVTAKGNGTATITASAEGKQATASITVRQVAATLSISPSTAGVQALGDSRTFTATATDARGNAVTTAIAWSSSDESIATVSGGVATGKSVGTATIAAASGDKRATASFTVAQVPASIALSADRTTIQVGTTAQLRANITDENGHPIPGAAPGYQSQNPSIATVSATGRVTAVSAGDATMTAGSGSLTATIVIHVTAVQGGPAPTTGASGVVRDGSTNQTISGATVSGPSGAPVTTGSDGVFTIPGVANGSNLGITATGYIGTTYFNVQAGANGIVSLGTLPIVPLSSQTGSFAGRIVDAVTGNGIPNAPLTVRGGINNTTGTVVLSTSTDQGGDYYGTLPAGTYTVLASAIGYANATGTVPVVGGSTQFNQNVVMSPAGLSNSQYRIVLQWGASPSDLDSHLVGPTGAGTNFEIAYYARSYSQNGTQIASLDQDVTSGFGPETITLSQTTAGHYRYYVHIFCCGNSFGTAHVTVYRGSSVAAQFSAPSQTGSVWTVFEIDGTTGGVASINTVSGTYNIPGNGSASFNVIPSRNAMPDDVSALLQRVKLHPKPLSETGRKK